MPKLFKRLKKENKQTNREVLSVFFINRKFEKTFVRSFFFGTDKTKSPTGEKQQTFKGNPNIRATRDHLAFQNRTVLRQKFHGLVVSWKSQQRRRVSESSEYVNHLCMGNTGMNTTFTANFDNARIFQQPRKSTSSFINPLFMRVSLVIKTGHSSSGKRIN